ncbi:MAG: glycoside hydrolase family 30 beta sandwich domain-containing protein [Terracidiphilus sp.]
MAKSSRRGFLKAASATAAAWAVSTRIKAWADQARAAGPVKVWSTFRDRRHVPGEPLAWKPAGEVAADAIALDPGAKKQEMLGFGAAMTDASCYVLSRIPETERQAVMHEMFAPEEMALNVCRTCIGSSDYSRTLYSFDESPEPDPELKKFSIDHDKAYILPMLREARKANPELFLFSSPWSPPGWMKPNGSMLGGCMRKQSYEPYAQYFLKFLDGYKAEGVAVDAVTVQNEVDAEQEGRMPACLWAQEQEIEFVKSHLGPALRKAGSPTKIWVLDHNYSLWGRAIDELSDPAAYEYIDGIAWHGYVGDASAMSRVHDAFPAKNAYWTEGGPDINAPDYQTDFSKWADTFNGIVHNWARSITSWNLALDEKGNPNIGPFSCGGVITVDNATRKVTRSGQYWAFAHYSKHVKRGAQVFATDGVGDQGAGGAVSHAGFRNPDGSFVVVLANRGPEKRAQLLLGTQALEVDLPADSVHTLQWA